MLESNLFKKLSVDVVNDAPFLKKFHIWRWPKNFPEDCLAWLKHWIIRNVIGITATTYPINTPLTVL